VRPDGRGSGITGDSGILGLPVVGLPAILARRRFSRAPRPLGARRRPVAVDRRPSGHAATRDYGASFAANVVTSCPPTGRLLRSWACQLGRVATHPGGDAARAASRPSSSKSRSTSRRRACSRSSSVNVFSPPVTPMGPERAPIVAPTGCAPATRSYRRVGSDAAAGEGGVDDRGDQLVASGEQVAVGVDGRGDRLVAQARLNVR
jgi:hypothetical protein